MLQHFFLFVTQIPLYKKTLLISNIYLIIYNQYVFNVFGLYNKVIQFYKIKLRKLIIILNVNVLKNLFIVRNRSINRVYL